MNKQGRKTKEKDFKCKLLSRIYIYINCELEKCYDVLKFFMEMWRLFFVVLKY
jgi:hypothetical protein